MSVPNAGLLLSSVAVATVLLSGRAALSAGSARASQPGGAVVPAAAYRFEPGVSPNRFVGRGGSGLVELRPDEMTLRSARTGRVALRVRLVSARKNASGRGELRLPGRITYASGRDTGRWRTALPTFGRVRYTNVYPGVDVAYYRQGSGLEYDFIVAPRADPGQIRLAIACRPGTRLENGDLVIPTPDGPVRQTSPIAYQENKGSRAPVAVRYVLEAPRAGGVQVRLAVGEYDRSRPLVIDPAIHYFADQSAITSDVAVDGAGFPYLAGETFGPGGGFDAFITKFTRDGSQIIYSLYIGGEGEETSGGVAVGADGSAYLTGNTSSPDFPVTRNAFQPDLSWTPEEPGDQPTTTDAFLVRVNPTGDAIAYATYLGGHWIENGLTWGDVAVDSAGNAYVAGDTESGDFPTLNALYPSSGNPDYLPVSGYLTKIARNGAVVYSTLFAGTYTIAGVAVDGSGAACVAGAGGGPGFPSVNAFQPEPVPGDVWSNAFAARFNPEGTALTYSTQLGGAFWEMARGVAVDESGSAYVTGWTASGDFPTVNAYQPRNGGALQGWGGYLEDGFLLRIEPDGTVPWSTYLGGVGTEFPLAITLDGAGRPTMTGRTASGDYPTVAPDQPEIHYFDAERTIPTTEGFVTKMERDGTGLAYSTFLGTQYADEGRGLAVDSGGGIFVAGNSIAGEFGYLGAERGGDAVAARRRRFTQRPFVSRLVPRRRPPAALAVDKKAVRFGSVTAGQESLQIIRVWNIGGGTLTGRVGTVDGPYRVVSGPAEFTLRGGQSVHLTIAFHPLTAGKQAGLLRFLVNAQPRPVRLPLSGLGT